jgi:hypothetical protein
MLQWFWIQRATTIAQVLRTYAMCWITDLPRIYRLGDLHSIHWTQWSVVIMHNKIARVVCHREDWCIVTEVSEWLASSGPKRDMLHWALFETVLRVRVYPTRPIFTTIALRALFFTRQRIYSWFRHGRTRAVLVPMVVRSKSWLCVRSLAGIVGSNPAGGMEVCCVFSGGGLCVGLITRTRGCYRVWCLSVITNLR